MNRLRPPSFSVDPAFERARRREVWEPLDGGPGDLRPRGGQGEREREDAPPRAEGRRTKIEGPSANF
jgi:hypothetical protein